MASLCSFSWFIVPLRCLVRCINIFLLCKTKMRKVHVIRFTTKWCSWTAAGVLRTEHDPMPRGHKCKQTTIYAYCRRLCKWVQSQAWAMPRWFVDAAFCTSKHPARATGGSWRTPWRPWPENWFLDSSRHPAHALHGAGWFPASLYPAPSRTCSHKAIQRHSTTSSPHTACCIWRGG